MLSAMAPACTRRLTTLLCVLALGLCLVGAPGGAAAASVYKWVDAAGVTHLSSEKPPAGVKFERLSVASTPSSARSSSAGKNPGRRAATPAWQPRRRRRLRAAMTPSTRCAPASA